MPSKNEVWSARVAHVVQTAAPFGTTVEGARTDMRKVLARKQAMVEREIAVHLAAYEESGAELIMGTGRFTGPRTIEVALNDGGTRTLSGAEVVIDVGTHAAMPDIPGLTDARPLTHIEALETRPLPAHLLVLGGGYVGIEMAQAFRRFGSRVTIVEPGPHLMSREDADVAEEVLRLAGRRGCGGPDRCQAGQGGRTVRRYAVTLTVQTGSGEETITGSDLLVATGRVPNTAGIGLELTGVALDPRGFIRVNERLETDAPGIWAIGECAGSPSSPMSRSTISGSFGTTWPAGTAGPATGWFPT